MPELAALGAADYAFAPALYPQVADELRAIGLDARDGAAARWGRIDVSVAYRVRRITRFAPIASVATTDDESERRTSGELWLLATWRP